MFFACVNLRMTSKTDVFRTAPAGGGGGRSRGSCVGSEVAPSRRVRASVAAMAWVCAAHASLRRHVVASRR